MSDKNKVNFSKKLHKYIEYGTTKIKLLFAQKKFTKNNITFKYILNKAPSDTLIVVLSSCTRKGLKARYNYMRTLKNINANQLFILDDFAKDHRGGYYIGSNYTFGEEEVVHSLIEKIIKDTKANKVIFCGSSKGGWSALNIGLQFKDAYIVAGGPQYFLGDYLISSENLDTLEHIIGEQTEEKMEKINHYLRDRIRYNNYKDTQKIYLHYSNKEHTYFEHIKDLVEELESDGYDLNEDIASYENHSDISYFFPDFMVESIKKIMLE